MPAPIVPEDLYRFRWIDHVRLSPDGERVAYQLGWADAEARQNRSRVVVRRLLEPEPGEATAGPRPGFAPGGAPRGPRADLSSRARSPGPTLSFDMTKPRGAPPPTARPDGGS